MVSLKRTIAALIVCFKPHVFLTLCILLVIAHSIITAIQRGASNSWRVGKQHDFTLTLTTLILIVALIWAAFFIFVVRFELRNELESLLILFQCSKRGLRFMGVVGFHVALLTFVSLIVSATVERSIPTDTGLEMHRLRSNSTIPVATIDELTLISTDGDLDGHEPVDCKSPARLTHAINPRRHDLKLLMEQQQQQQQQHGYDATSSNRSKLDRNYLLTVYKIWLTAIVYAFLYLVIENLVMFYADMSLVEFVHIAFLALVAKVTGIDLSDYPAGEMLFNPLVRHRIR